MRPPGRTTEREIALIAGRQHGVVTRDQLLAAGITSAAIQRRLRKGALWRAHRGVYRVGHFAPSFNARYMAAVLASRRVIHGDVKVVLSVLERRFLELMTESGMELPVTNRLIGGRRVDCHWPLRRLTVELDGYRFHRSRHAWVQDRRREREARARGEEFRRFTYGDVLEDPRFMLRELLELLGPGG